MNTFALGGRFLSAFGRGRGIPINTTPSFMQQSTNDPFARYYGNESRGGGRGKPLSSDFDRASFDKKSPTSSIGDDLFSVIDQQATREKKTVSSGISEILRQEQNRIVESLSDQPSPFQNVLPGRGRGRSAKSLAPTQLKEIKEEEEEEEEDEFGEEMSEELEEEIKEAEETMKKVLDYEIEGAKEKGKDGSMELNTDMDLDADPEAIRQENNELRVLLSEYESVPYDTLTSLQKAHYRHLTLLYTQNDKTLDPELVERENESIIESARDVAAEEPDFYVSDPELAKYGDSDPELLFSKAFEMGERYYKALLDDTASAYKKIWTRKEEVTQIKRKLLFNQREIKRKNKAKRKELGIPERVLPQPKTGEEYFGGDLEYLIRDVPAEHPVHAFARMVSQNPTIPLVKKRTMVQSYIRELDKAQKKFQTLSPTGASLYGVKRITIEEIETS